jgi:pyruvate/2-oxoglutarate dehydrogenase complex dihydrolipoamide acyltransferase (E2) component
MMNKKRIPLMVPDIGDAGSIEVVSWNVQPGQSVSENQELCELVTDKAAFPLECPHSGRIVEIIQPRGSTVKVGDALAILEVEET